MPIFGWVGNWQLFSINSTHNNVCLHVDEQHHYYATFSHSAKAIAYCVCWQHSFTWLSLILYIILIAQLNLYNHVSVYTYRRDELSVQAIAKLRNSRRYLVEENFFLSSICKHANRAQNTRKWKKLKVWGKVRRQMFTCFHASGNTLPRFTTNIDCIPAMAGVKKCWKALGRRLQIRG